MSRDCVRAARGAGYNYVSFTFAVSELCLLIAQDEKEVCVDQANRFEPLEILQTRAERCI